MMNLKQSELTALQNMANHAGHGIKVYSKELGDRRKTVGKYFANIGNETISPVLDYTSLNCFLMGFAKKQQQ